MANCLVETLCLAPILAAPNPFFFSRTSVRIGPRFVQEPSSTDTSEEAIWNLAQYVDLVDAGYGAKDATYAGAKARLALHVRTLWQQPGKRSLFSRSAALMAFVNDQLDEQALSFELPLGQALAA